MQITEWLTGELVDERLELTLSDLCRACAVHAELVIAMVDEGLLEPRGAGPGEWRFPGPSLRRMETALRLQHDLDLNLAGAVLAIELIEEIERLRARLAAIEGRGID